jgi:hypothetical protein
LGASGAAVLSGCGGGHVVRALPGVAQTNSVHAPSKSLTLVPATADPIPDNILKNPFIGEARRFDAAAAPSGWILAQGQSIPIGDNPKLFSILGHGVGDKATTTFLLPNPGFGLIVAAAGIFPTSPSMLTQSGRHMTPQDSLGPNARRPTARAFSFKVQRQRDERDAAILEARRRAASALRVPPQRAAVRVSPELDARIDRARENARANVLARLSDANRAGIEGLIEAILGGRISPYQATVQMTASLSLREARAVLDVSDATQLEFRPGWPGMDHPNPQLEAGRYAVDVAFSREQLRAFRTMRQNG